jgi:predicted esterase
VRWRGRLPIPIFQQGTPPYATPAQGGRIDLAPAALAPARTEEVRFALTLPLGEMPAAGWPLVLYSHGTGGSYESFLGDGTATRFARPDDDGQPLPPLAVLGIDQVLHGPRDPTGASPELTFFNYMNPPAARDNVRQGGADEFQVLRLARAGIGPLRFDPQRIYFMGHSQGGITGPPFLAAEPDVPAAVLSGAGGHLVLSLLHKTQPVDLPALLRGLLGEDLDESHPVLNLLQTYIEPADPLNYGRLFFREPPAGMRPKSIYQSMGLVDHFTPVPTIAAFALAMGVDAVAPLLEPIPGLDLTGRAPVARPVAGNVAGGAATGVLAQYSAGGGEGHFVLFRVAQAQRDHVRFLRNHARDGVARLGP